MSLLCIVYCSTYFISWRADATSETKSARILADMGDILNLQRFTTVLIQQNKSFHRKYFEKGL